MSDRLPNKTRYGGTKPANRNLFSSPSKIDVEENEVNTRDHTGRLKDISVLWFQLGRLSDCSYLRWYPGSLILEQKAYFSVNFSLTLLITFDYHIVSFVFVQSYMKNPTMVWFFIVPFFFLSKRIGWKHLSQTRDHDYFSLPWTNSLL